MQTDLAQPTAPRPRSDDVRERIAAGASLVQGYTGFIYRGPGWAREINRGLLASS